MDILRRPAVVLVAAVLVLLGGIVSAVVVDENEGGDAPVATTVPGISPTPSANVSSLPGPPVATTPEEELWQGRVRAVGERVVAAVEPTRQVIPLARRQADPFDALNLYDEVSFGSGVFDVLSEQTILLTEIPVPASRAAEHQEVFDALEQVGDALRSVGPLDDDVQATLGVLVEEIDQALARMRAATGAAARTFPPLEPATSKAGYLLTIGLRCLENEAQMSLLRESTFDPPTDRVGVEQLLADTRRYFELSAETARFIIATPGPDLPELARLRAAAGEYRAAALRIADLFSRRSPATRADLVQAYEQIQRAEERLADIRRAAGNRTCSLPLLSLK